MQLKSLASLTSAAALLIAMSAAPALADSASGQVTQTNTNQITNNGDASNPTTPAAGSTQSSAINGSAGAGAQGNIGFNAAAGNGNQQDNVLIMESRNNPSSGGGLNGSTYSNQTQSNVTNGGTSSVSKYVSNNNTSTLGDTGASGPVPGASQGNFGANSAAGDFNEQVNVTVLSAKPAAAEANNGNSTSFGQINQSISIPANSAYVSGGTDMRGQSYQSSITGTMGHGVSGNAAFNSAAGEKNVQENGLLLYTDSNAAPIPTEARQETSQVIGPVGNANAYGDTVHQTNGSYSSTLGGTALQGATGNVGANSASGASNLQANNAIIAGTTPLTNVTQTVTQTIRYGSYDNTANPGATVRTTNAYNSAIAPTGVDNGSGNVGINSTAGAQNIQENSILIADPPALTQNFNQNVNGGAAISFADGSTSSIGGGTASGFSGRFGANSSIGAQNLQSNKADLIGGGVSSATQNFNQQVNGSLGTETDAFPNGTRSVMNGNAAQSASGSIGFNSAAGVQNIQANGVIIVSGASTSPNASQYNPPSGSTQVQEASSTFMLTTGARTANVGGNVGQGATGNLGANNATGLQNIQNNGLILGTASGGTATNPSATQAYSQKLTVNSSKYFPASSVLGADYSFVNGSAAQGSSGVIGFNNASGAQNQQSNAAIVFAPAPFSTSTSTPGGASGTPSASISNTQNVAPDPTNGGSVTFLNENAVTQVGGAAGSSGSVGQNATGVVGFNAAAGAGNQQSFVTTVMTNNAPNGAASALNGFSSASVQNAQSINNLGVNQIGGVWNSGIDGNTLNHGTGVLSANAATGAYNQQANSVLLSTGSPAAGSNIAGPTLSSTQSVDGSGTTTTVSGTWYGRTAIGDYLPDSPGATGNSPGAYARGVVTFNAASGIGNEQSSNVTIMDNGLANGSPTPGGTFSSGPNFTNQQTIQNLNVSRTAGAASSAAINGNTLQNAAGVLSANATTGAYNQQSNVVLLTTANLANVNVPSTKSSSGNTIVDTSPNTAGIGGNAFAGASGVIMSNVSAGVGNQQGNTVIVSH